MVPRIHSAKTALGLLALLALLSSAPARAQDDTALFSSAVPPNVMLFIDNSSSMNEIMWHPALVVGDAANCPIFPWAAPNSGSNPPNYPGGAYNTLTYNCVASSNNCRFEIDEATAGFVQTSTVSCPGGGTRKSGYVTRSFCGRSRNLYVDGEATCQGNKTRYSEEYVEWYYSAAADALWIGSEANTSTDVNMVDATRNGTHYVTNSSFGLYKRTRITAAKEIARDVIYQVDSNCSLGGGFPCPAGGKDVVRFGTGRFDASSAGDYPGSFVSAPIDNYSTNANSLNNAITALEGETWTPLGEALFKIYTYFMSRTTTERPFGKNGTTRFPKYQYNTTDGANTGSPPGDPLSCPPGGTKCACQKNFVIMITDGAPTRDDFQISGAGNSNTTGRTVGFADFVPNLIGDYNADGEVEEPAATDSWLYLDDIAKFMQDNDFRPDLAGMQVIDVYTVGFATDTAANNLLQKTAAVGNGLFFTGTQAQELTDALVGAINSIILKSQSFTAATVPATRTSFGGKFYNSLFVPSDESGYWEGHLQSWEITEAGEIRDRNGACAFNGNPVPCLEGTFNPSAVPFWDAGDNVPAPASRSVYTSRIVSGTPQRSDFTAANIDDTHLGVLLAENGLYTYTPPSVLATSAGQLADMVVENVRGCKFGTGVGAVTCQERTDQLGGVHRLGDIFHSNPVVVGRPQGFLPEPSYKAFASPATNIAVAERDQVLVAGANDGLFRIFDAGTWGDPDGPTNPLPPSYSDGTGAERAGFMPYTARKNSKYLARDTGSRDYYFADGSPIVADVWFYSDPTLSGPLDKTQSEWHTVVVSGMRQGGNQYFALDITDPDAGSYPGYLWEFPREDAAASVTQWMGQTWSEPIVTKVRLAVDGDVNSPQERWVAIFGGGYDRTGDPNNSFYDLHATAGRSLTMLDLKTGRVVAQKKFVDTPVVTDPALIAYNPLIPETNMLFAIPSTPGVFDLDADGFADVVYVGDLGGNMWKWVISNVGHDPVNSTVTTTAQDGSEDGGGGLTGWHFEKFFGTPPYPAPPAAGPRHYKSFYFNPSATLKNGVLWLAFGSGERTDLKYAGLASPADENNRFYAMKDLDPLAANLAVPQKPLCEGVAATCANTTAMLDLSGTTACSDIGTSPGFYLKGVDGEKFVTATDIFFYYVFVASFTPQTSTDPCAAGGKATLYAFKVYCGEGLFEDAGGNPVVTIDLGDGMPTDPKVSLSGADGGSRVFINKKDEVLSKDTGFNLDDSTGQAYWRELHE